MHYALYLARKKEQGSPYLSASQVTAIWFENRFTEMGDMRNMTSQQIIDVLGSPDRIKNNKNGGRRLIWKGRKHHVIVDVDDMGCFIGKDESYT